MLSTSYQLYFSLALFHDYYQQKVCPDFIIEPTRVCQQILKGHRMVFKPSINGLQVLIPVTENQQPVLPPDPSLVFTFLLELKKTGFVSFTNLEPNYHPNRSLYTFSNESTEKKGALDLKPRLVERESLDKAEAASSVTVGADAIAALKIFPPGKVFGVIEIYNRDFSKLPKQDRIFKITFAPQKQVWKYYLIIDKSVSPSAFSIQDKASAVRFSNSNVEDGDRIAAAIQQRFPDSQTILLCSEAQVVSYEVGKPDLQLIKKETSTEKNKVWISNLPNPPDRHGVQVINLLKAV